MQMTKAHLPDHPERDMALSVEDAENRFRERFPVWNSDPAAHKPPSVRPTTDWDGSLFLREETANVEIGEDDPINWEDARTLGTKFQ